MAEQGGKERHQHPRHARHFHQLPKQHEERHREQDQRAHPLVHPTDDDGELALEVDAL